MSTEAKKELIDWIETMHLQNTSGRESPREMFRLGVEAAIDELFIEQPEDKIRRELALAFLNGRYSDADTSPLRQ